MIDKYNKGITLIALVVTIIILIILSTVAAYTGIKVMNSSKLTTFTTEFKIMQVQVNKLYDRYLEEPNSINEIGKNLSTIQSQANNVFTTCGINDMSGYRYYDKQTIVNDLGIEGVEGEFFVNVSERSVISCDGLEYEGETYYTLDQIPNSLYNVKYEDNSYEPTFNLSYQDFGNNKHKIIVSNIEFEGNINTWKIQWKENGSTNWYTEDTLYAFVDKGGNYDVRVISPDEKITSEVSNIYVYDTDYVETRTENSYRLNGRIQFTGENYIDTGLSLFDIDNVDKDFEINFTINKIDEDNQNQDTIVNSLNEANSPWQGFVVRMSGTSDIAFKANSTSSNRQENTVSKNNAEKVKIRRINKKLYYSINDGTEIELIDYTDITKAFSFDLTFGASLSSTRTPQRWFKGELSDISVEILDYGNYKLKYQHIGTIAFNGTNNINTGVKLFDSQNVNKNFRISFDLVQKGTNETQATFVNAKDESGSPWPGFCVRRIEKTDEPSYYELGATSSSKSIVVIEDDNKEKNIKIKRNNNKLYYSVNNENYTMLKDFTDLAWNFDVPLTFGSSLDSSGNPFRFFVGTLRNIRVEVEE